MKNLFKTVTALFLLGFLILGFKAVEKQPVKCLIQMTNYSGEGAYVVISLLNPKGEYEETLYVHGKDSEWYKDVSKWWKFYGKYRPNIDAISGETISGGERMISLIRLPLEKIDKGYSIRFETSVEDKDYIESDVQFLFTTENIKSKHEGSGFIRYVRMMPK